MPETNPSKLTPEEAKDRIEEHKANGCIGIAGIAFCLFLLSIWVYLYRTQPTGNVGSTIGHLILIGGALAGLFFAVRGTLLSYARASAQARRIAPPVEPMTRAQRAKAILFPPDKPREALPHYRPPDTEDQWIKSRNAITEFGVVAVLIIPFVFVKILSFTIGYVPSHPEDTSGHVTMYIVLALIVFFEVLTIRKTARSRHDFHYFGLMKKLPEPPPPAEKPSEDPRERYNRMREEVEAFNNEYADAQAPLDDHRPYHVWIAGLPGQGKTELMKLLAEIDFSDGKDDHWQSIYPPDYIEPLFDRKKGVTVIDPHGDLAEKLLARIPNSRIHETIYFDLKNPVPIDFLSWSTVEEQRAVVQSILDLFRMFSNRVGAEVGKVMEDLLVRLLWTLTEAENVSFLDIRNFLEDSDQRSKIIEQAGIDPSRRNYFRRAQLNAQDILPVTRLLSPIGEDPILRQVFNCPHSRAKDAPHTMLRLSDVFFERKILIVNLAHNVVTDPTPQIIAALIIAKLQQAAFSQPGPESNRIPHYIYADEFQTYQQTSEFETLLTEARKFRLCMTMANQRFDQLSDATLRGLETVKNWYLFKLHHEDARRICRAGLTIHEKELYNRAKEPDARTLTRELAKHLDPWQMMNVRDVVKPIYPEILTNLKRFHAIHRDGRDGGDLVHRVKTPPWDAYKESPDNYAAVIKKRTIDIYGCPACRKRLPSSQDDSIRPTGPPRTTGSTGESQKKAIPQDKGKGGGPRNPR